MLATDAGRMALPAAEVHFPAGAAAMLLAIDVGNTNTVFALHDGARGRRPSGAAAPSASAPRTNTSSGCCELMRNQRHRPSASSAVVISSVVPQVVFNLRVLSDRYFDTRAAGRRQARGAGSGRCRASIRRRRSAPTGWSTPSARFDRYGGNLIVVDFGTATTFDVVGSDGAYEGGVIAPGVNLSLKALHDAAAALPFIDVTKPDRVVGTNTVACMQSGIYLGLYRPHRGHLRPHPRRTRAAR